MRLENELTDGAVLAELGHRIAQRRLERGLTQQQLADEAGVSRHTLLRMEAGNGVTLDAFVRILRALHLLAGLEQLVPEPPPSPLEQLRRERGRRRRAAAGSRRDAPATDVEAEPRDWPWGTR